MCNWLSLLELWPDRRKKKKHRSGNQRPGVK
jgi:hypothetical protein